MWILWKLRIWKGEFCQNRDFETVNFVKNDIFQTWFLDKMSIFAPDWNLLNKYIQIFPRFFPRFLVGLFVESVGLLKVREERCWAGDFLAVLGTRTAA